MPIPLKPPSRVDPLNFPVFAMSWYANPGNGLSLLAYCGGGGSAKTGVNNAILVRAPDGETRRIDTGEKVGVALKIAGNPVSGRIFLFVAVSQSVERYDLPSCEKSGELHVGGEGVNAINVNVMVDQLACGCENGDVKVYKISDDSFRADSLRHICKGHTNTVCCVDFSSKGDRMVSSAKDGTARVWQGEETVAELKCSVEGGKEPVKKRRVNPNRPVQVLVRGCAFGDLEGKVVYTVASTRLGTAFLARWKETPGEWEAERRECCDVPISAMNLSSDGFLLALGSVTGSIILWGVEHWKPLKVFKEVHDLPVTCIAARPYDAPLQGEDDGIRYHAISASGDSRLGNLSLQAAPRQSSPGAFNRFLSSMYGSIVFLILATIVVRPVVVDFWEKCGYEWDGGCLLNDVLVAPDTHPGIKVPPH